MLTSWQAPWEKRSAADVDANDKQTPAVDPANVVQALVYTLLGVFDATRDLFQTLKAKEQRDYESSLRSKGYPASRRVEYVEDENLGRDEDLVMDKAAVTRQFEIGFQNIGALFAVGDGMLDETTYSTRNSLTGL